MSRHRLPGASLEVESPPALLHAARRRRHPRRPRNGSGRLPGHRRLRGVDRRHVARVMRRSKSRNPGKVRPLQPDPAHSRADDEPEPSRRARPPRSGGRRPPRSLPARPRGPNRAFASLIGTAAWERPPPSTPQSSRRGWGASRSRCGTPCRPGSRRALPRIPPPFLPRRPEDGEAPPGRGLWSHAPKRTRTSTGVAR